MAKRPKRSVQLAMIKSQKSAYGGDLRKTRMGRAHGRPLATRETMHLVLRSTQATGEWSFRRPRHFKNISAIVEKFGLAYGVRVISMANVGNHLHMQIRLSNRFTYNAFIRAITGAIAMSVTRRNRWTNQSSKTTSKLSRIQSENSPSRAGASDAEKQQKFWDHRPFTRIIQSFSAYLRLKDYVRINQLEGEGFRRDEARMMIDVEKQLWGSS